MFAFAIGMYLWTTVVPVVEFVPAKAVIKPASFGALGALGAAIVARGCSHVEVHGHTDRVLNPWAARDLTRDRAEAVRDYLVEEAGVAAESIVAKGFGDSTPRVLPTTPGASRINRRIEVVLSGCLR